jgi:hypothetical protein
VDEAIFVLDAEADGRFVFAGCNPAFERLAAGRGAPVSAFLGSEIGVLAGCFQQDAVDDIASARRRPRSPWNTRR